MRILILLCVLLFPAVAGAQVMQVSLATGKLAWAYTPATGSDPVDGWNMKCGQTAGVYMKTTQIANGAARNILISQVITGSGNWFCKVFTYTQTTSGPLEGVASNEVPFVAKAGPSGTISMSITAQ